MAQTVPTRALGYVRVSTAREDMISPELQERAIRDHCARHGYRLVDVHADLDQSGRSFARAEVQRVVERVEAGEAAVVIVWKVSRFGRTRRDWYVHADRLEVAGGRLESATEGFDAASSVGKFTRGMLVELAAFESDRIGDVWREVHERRVRDGYAPNGKPKAGYIYDPEQGLHMPDPDLGPMLAECYRRYVGGASVYALVRDLNQRGHRTTAGGLWTDSALRRVLDSGFAAGFVPYRGELHEGRHQPLIDRPTWDAYRARRAETRQQPARTKRSPYLLSGLVKCSRCGGPMHGGQFGAQRRPKYRCKRSHETSGTGCAGGYVMAATVESAVLAWLRPLADDLEEATAAAEARRARADAREQDAARISREVTRLEAALVKLAQREAEGELSEATYRSARDDYTGRLDVLQGQLSRAEAEARRVARPLASYVRGTLDGGWDVLPMEGQQAILRALIRRVVVETGRPKAQVHVVPVWESDGTAAS